MSTLERDRQDDHDDPAVPTGGKTGSRGPLIALEGIDGSGTTTQARRLYGHLRSIVGESLGMRWRDRVPHLTRQPSSGPVGLLIREMLHDKYQVWTDDDTADDMTVAPTSPATMAALFAADRYDHLQREVEPALARGRIVVSDRWLHSSFAYQGSTREVGHRWVSDLNLRVREPDLTIFLRCDPEVALRRRVAAGRKTEMFDDLATQRRIAAAYEDVFADVILMHRIRQQMVGVAVDVAIASSERAVILDGERAEDDVHREVASLVERLLMTWPWAPREAGA